MARCYNCGCDIPEDDKTRLCDECKKVLLPFVKFMDASTSSAVRRLVSNETNLRNAGVTDSGMEYLLRICELHDRKKAESEAVEEIPEEGNVEEELFGETAAPAEEVRPETPAQYTDIEIPLDKPLKLIRKTYGQYLAAAELVLGLIAVALIAWFLVDLIAWHKVDFTAVASAIASGVGVYIADCVRRMIYDVEEVKKHFR